jgi:hypothetical protein
MARVFENPANGYREELTSWVAVVAAFFLGPLYLALKGVWTHFFVWLVLAIIGLGTIVLAPFYVIVHVGYMLATPEIVAGNYLRRGWREVR